MSKLQAGLLTVSSIALLTISSQEGFSPIPYKDINGVLTNGYGNATINPARNVTQKQALADLNQNVSMIGKKISQCIKVPITQNQYDAYINLSYNIGSSAFCKSTLVKTLNAGDDIGSCNQIMRWTYVGNKDCKIKANKCGGIVARREAMKNLCLEGLE